MANIIQQWKNFNLQQINFTDTQKEDYLQQILSLQIDNQLYKESEQECQSIKEQAIQQLGQLYIKQENGASKIQNLIVNKNEVFKDISKTKMAKVIRNLIDLVQKIEKSEQIQIDLCVYLVDWCIREKRSYLRQRIEIKLANLYGEKGEYQKGLDITEQLTKEVRKSDDKHLLVEVQLAESIIQFKLKNMAKAKASLTASRACSNQIYCPLLLQAEIDKMNGILLAEDKDYKTAYSYFFESFEALNSLEEHSKAVQVLKYMMLTKIMTSQYDDLKSLYNGKYGLKYQGIQIEAMKEVGDAHQKKSITRFQEVLSLYKDQIYSDMVISNHISTLYDNLLISNLIQIIEPYSTVQLSYISSKLNLNVDFVLNKLSLMILDNQINGTLDQGNGCLIIFDDLPQDNLYANSLQQMQAMNLVVDKLFEKAQLLKQ